MSPYATSVLMCVGVKYENASAEDGFMSPYATSILMCVGVKYENASAEDGFMSPYATSVSTAFTNYANFHENCVNSSVTLYMQWAPYIIIIEVYYIYDITYRYSFIQLIWDRIKVSCAKFSYFCTK